MASIQRHFQANPDIELGDQAPYKTIGRFHKTLLPNQNRNSIRFSSSIFSGILGRFWKSTPTKDALNCTICTDPITEQDALSGGCVAHRSQGRDYEFNRIQYVHHHHTNCIEQWRKMIGNNFHCPSCRFSLTDKPPIDNLPLDVRRHIIYKKIATFTSSGLLTLGAAKGMETMGIPSSIALSVSTIAGSLLTGKAENLASKIHGIVIYKAAKAEFGMFGIPLIAINNFSKRPRDLNDRPFLAMVEYLTAVACDSLLYELGYFLSLAEESAITQSVLSSVLSINDSELGCLGVGITAASAAVSAQPIRTAFWLSLISFELGLKLKDQISRLNYLWKTRLACTTAAAAGLSGISALYYGASTAASMGLSALVAASTGLGYFSAGYKEKNA